MGTLTVSVPILGPGRAPRTSWRRRATAGHLRRTSPPPHRHATDCRLPVGAEASPPCHGKFPTRGRPARWFNPSTNRRSRICHLSAGGCISAPTTTFLRCRQSLAITRPSGAEPPLALSRPGGGQFPTRPEYFAVGRTDQKTIRRTSYECTTLTVASALPSVRSSGRLDERDLRRLPAPTRSYPGGCEAAADLETV
jgi:hypothetical protein